MSSTITIDAAGRLVLPKKVRDRLGLVGGSRLRVDLMGERIELSPEDDESCELLEKDGVLIISGAKTTDAAAAVKASRSDREETLTERAKRRNSGK